MVKIYNPKSSKEKRQALRRFMPAPEIQLWQKLKNKQLGVKFRRQHGIGSYIADFYSAEIKLIIEVDGDSHFNPLAKKYDEVRTRYFNAHKIKVIRFSNNDVMKNIDSVIEQILLVIRRLKATPT